VLAAARQAAALAAEVQPLEAAAVEAREQAPVRCSGCSQAVWSRRRPEL